MKSRGSGCGCGFDFGSRAEWTVSLKESDVKGLPGSGAETQIGSPFTVAHLSTTREFAIPVRPKQNYFPLHCLHEALGRPVIEEL